MEKNNILVTCKPISMSDHYELKDLEPMDGRVTYDDVVSKGWELLPLEITEKEKAFMREFNNMINGLFEKLMIPPELLEELIK